MQHAEGLSSNPHLLELGVANGTPFRVDAALVATGRTCVIGASGSGKSYAVAVICEELCKNKVPFAIVDTEGEYSGLKDKYEAILVSNDDSADLKWSEIDLGELASQAPDIAPLILDTSEVEDQKGTVRKVLEQLYNVLSERRTPYLVILEEADRFVPQAGERVPIIGEIARRGRKRGIGLMVCTQRPSLVDKNILSQCSNQLIGKLVIQNDLMAVSQFFSAKGVPKVLTSLGAGNFYAMGGLSDHPVLVKIRKRETRHGGFTPELKERTIHPYMGTLGLRIPHKPATEGGAQASGTKTELMNRGKMGFELIVPESEVPLRVSREKKHKFFGEEEKVSSISLSWRPLQVVTVLQIRGLIRKGFRARFLLLDSLTGAEVKLGDGIKFGLGLQELLGLSEKQVRILRVLHEDSAISIADVEGRTGYTRGVLGRALYELEERKLVSSSDRGRFRVYRRLIRVPDLDLLDEPPKAQPIEYGMASAKQEADAKNLDSRQVREVVKGLIDDSDATEFSTVYYPLWKVGLAMGSRSRVVWVDGRTGREVEVPRAVHRIRL